VDTKAIIVQVDGGYGMNGRHHAECIRQCKDMEKKDKKLRKSGEMEMAELNVKRKWGTPGRLSHRTKAKCPTCGWSPGMIGTGTNCFRKFWSSPANYQDAHKIWS
jgi:hypothetical protein